MLISPLRLERRPHKFDLLILPSLEGVKRNLHQTLEIIGRSLERIVKFQVKGQKHPEILLIAGIEPSLMANIAKIFYPHYQIVGIKRDCLNSLNSLCQIFHIEKSEDKSNHVGDSVYLWGNNTFFLDKNTEVWIAIAYGDTLPEASANYLKFFGNASYPWHICRTSVNNVFTPGWKISVSSAFLPDAEFDLEREIEQAQKMTQDFYTGLLTPISAMELALGNSATDKQLRVIYGNQDFWQISSAIPKPKKVWCHNRLLFMERSRLIQNEMKMG